MERLNRIASLVLVVLLAAAGAGSEIRAAEMLNLVDDGWYTWRVASVSEFEEDQFYVLVKSGEPRKIEIVGHWCSDRKHSGAVDLGLQETDVSIDWFQQYTGTRSDLGSDALAAVSRHTGSRALRILIDIVESDAHMDVREEAVFWMVQSESEDAYDYLDRLLMAN
jgi:hypothetical protein